MEVIPVAEAPSRIDEIANVLREGGLACIPLRGAYRVVADATSLDAVNRLTQSKRRAKNHPTLIVVADLAAAASVVEGTGWDSTKRITGALWPGPLTLVLPPSEELPKAVRKVLAKATGKLGIRVPQDDLTRQVVKAFGGPLLMSSANLEKKPGANSAATIRQRFTQAVDVWVDAGDIPAQPPSTLIELTETGFSVLREGAVKTADIQSALA